MQGLKIINVSLFFSLLFYGAPMSATEDIIERVDHFIVASSQPEQLYSYFHEELKLAVAWPFESYGEYSSGGLSLGNAVLEVVNSPDRSVPAFVAGVALIPTADAETTRSRLESLNVNLASSEIFRQPGSNEILWETMTVLDLTSQRLNLFICDYKDRKFIQDNRQTAARQFSQNEGGPLGIVEVAALQLVTDNVDRELETWSRILQSDSSYNTEGVIKLDSGPEIHLSARNHLNTDNTIVLKVRSLERAQSWLNTSGMTSDEMADRITITSDNVQGLKIVLLE